jgi:hypothetical protein
MAGQAGVAAVAESELVMVLRLLPGGQFLIDCCF